MNTSTTRTALQGLFSRNSRWLSQSRIASPLSIIQQTRFQTTEEGPQGVQSAAPTEQAPSSFLKSPPSYAPSRRYASKETPSHHLHVYSHKHNTHITLTRPNYTVLLSLSCGNIGLRKAQRKSYDAAHQLTAHVLNLIKEKGLLSPESKADRIRKVEVILKGFGVGREAFTKALLGIEGRDIKPLIAKFTDATVLKFGSPRSRQTRRLG